MTFERASGNLTPVIEIILKRFPGMAEIAPGIIQDEELFFEQLGEESFQSARCLDDQSEPILRKNGIEELKLLPRFGDDSKNINKNEFSTRFKTLLHVVLFERDAVIKLLDSEIPARRVFKNYRLALYRLSFELYLNLRKKHGDRRWIQTWNQIQKGGIVNLDNLYVDD